MKKAAITAAIVIFILAVGIGALFTFGYWPFVTEKGEIKIPDTAAFPETTSEATELSSEGLTFKGTFNYEKLDGGVKNDSDTCYLRIHMTDTGTQAKFSFGEYQIDGWPVFLISKSDNHYVFESSKNSFVERVRLIVDVTDTGMTGTVENLTDISSFVKGNFTGDSIPYEQYKADVLD